MAIQSSPTVDAGIAIDWRQSLPALCGTRVTLRELDPSDAHSLYGLLTAAEVSRFATRPPSTVEGFERFISWTLRQRYIGENICFAVTLAGDDTAIGVMQLRELERSDRSAGWGFALGSPFWGSGVFAEAADLALTFAFERLCVHRVEARACAQNGRGNAALRKIGAVNEALLRRSLPCGAEYMDQNLWTILQDDWQLRKSWSRRGGLILH